MQACQQLAGINTVMYYGPFILRDAGFGSEGNRALLINTLPLSFVSFLGGFTAIRVSEKWGRRASIMTVLPIIGLAMVALSLSMFAFYMLEWKEIGGWGAQGMKTSKV